MGISHSQSYVSSDTQFASTVLPAMVKVADVTVAAAANQVTLSSTLDLATDGCYLLVSTIKNIRAGSNEFLLLMNNDSTAGNYNFQYLSAASTTVGAARSTSGRFAECAAQNETTTCQVWISKDPDGYTCFNSNQNYRATTNITIENIVCRWNSTANVTRIDVKSNQAGNNIEIGSRFMLFKVR